MEKYCKSLTNISCQKAPIPRYSIWLLAVDGAFNDIPVSQRDLRQNHNSASALSEEHFHKTSFN